MSDPAYTDSDAWHEFLKAMAAQGITTRDKISPDAKLQRFHVEGERKGTKNGALIFHSDHPASGWFSSYKTGLSETWSMLSPSRMDDAERDALAKRMADTKRQRAAELAASHAMCRTAAAALMAAVEPARADNPYLVRKGLAVTPGLRQLARDVRYTVADHEKPNRTARAGDLVIPIYGPDKTLHSCQTIAGDGRKHFLFGTNKKGHYWSIGKLTPRLIIAEGYSTAASIHMATGCCVIIAFDAGNLKPVAKAIRAKYPEHEIVIGADNDRFTTAPIPNPGMTKACEAAVEVNGLVAWPEFDDGVTLPNGDIPNDFNDLAAVHGNLESVSAAFEAAVRPADIENHTDPRHAVERPSASVAIEVEGPVVALALPEISERSVQALKGQGFDGGSEVEIATALRRVAADDMGSLIYADGDFWTFCATYWQKLDRDRLRRAIHLLDGAPLGEKRSSKRLKLSSRMIDGIIRELATTVRDDRFFDDPAPGIPAANCLITFGRDGRVRTTRHHPDHRRRFVIACEFEPLTAETGPADGSLLAKLLERPFFEDPDKADKIALIGEMLGAAAAGIATQIAQPKALVLHGVSAENGKSSIAELFSALLPARAICCVSPRDMADKAHVIALVGAAANIVDELGGAKLAGEVFKAVITGNPITGRDLYRSATTFRPGALHVLTTNSLPHFAGGLDRGLQRRIIVLEFKRPIPKSEMIPGIAARVGRDELASLLAFAVDGAARLIRQGTFTVPASSADALESWLLDEPVREWAAKRLIVCPEKPSRGWPLASRDLRPDFVDWLRGEGYPESFAPPPNVFTKVVRGLPGVRGTIRDPRGSRVIGVRLADAA